MKSKKTILLFAYGTLMTPYGNNAYLRNEEFIGNGKTLGKYTMYVSGVPFINEHEKTSQISGELWKVNTKILPYIDSLEGHPYWYERKETIVIVNGQEYLAWLYFNNDSSGTKIEDGNFKNYTYKKRQNV